MRFSGYDSANIFRDLQTMVIEIVVALRLGITGACLYEWFDSRHNTKAIPIGVNQRFFFRRKKKPVILQTRVIN
jgi:hypothetical protein